MTAGRVAGAKLWTTGLALVAALAVQRAEAQLEITEIMSAPNNGEAWEWIEIRNTGATDVDLNGYFIDRLGDPRIPAGSATPSIVLGQSTNTTIPAGGVAVLYDGDGPLNAQDYNDAFFRQAWGLAPSVPLIGVAFNFGGGLTNGTGTSLGLWPDLGAYEMDLADDGTGTVRVAQFNNATTSIDFRTASGFPTVPGGTSITWNGSGSFQNGANWAVTPTGTTSVLVTTPGSTNNPLDRGNPGFLPGPAPAGITFTEIMYNPASTDSAWEWVEFHNNSGLTLDFGANPAVFDDNDDAKLTAANVTSGIVPTGTTAVFFNANVSPTTPAGITISDMQAAWDPDGTRGINFIPVNRWLSELGNTGDNFGLWLSYDAYNTEANTGSGTRTMDNAVAQGGYDDATLNVPGMTGAWPNANGGSIYLIDPSSDRFVGDNWIQSYVNPPEPDPGNSFNAAAIAGTITVHPGGDLGTPGVFVVGPPPGGVGANFDGLGVVDAADLAIWEANFGTGTTQPTGDANGDGKVDGADFLVWQQQLGTTPAAAAAASAVPEPAGCALALLSLAAAAGFRRRAG